MRHSLPISPQTLSTPGCLDENAVSSSQQQRQRQWAEQPVCTMLKGSSASVHYKHRGDGATQAPCLLHISRATLLTWLRAMGVQDMGKPCPTFITC